MKKLGKFFAILFVLVIFLGILLAAGVYGVKIKTEEFLRERGHGEGAARGAVFEESARKLDNPNRGFYFLRGFYIRDGETDYETDVKELYEEDESAITLVEINLHNYWNRPISEEGLSNLEKLFEALEKTDKNLLVRFLYDWDGQNMDTEPEEIDTILGHMHQVSDCVNRRSGRIFTMQGLFIGNWGEMNGTRYTTQESMKILSETLESLTDDSIFLAVRVPVFWRLINEVEDLDGLSSRREGLASRMGLYNDGMLGSATDVGTYTGGPREESDYFSSWDRESELAFQSELCRWVPNGGEAILANEYNDFENAIRDMRSMHVTYLHRNYDLDVLNKWEEAVFSGNGCFDGMNGLDYIERHLGYRLLIKDVSMAYQSEEDMVSVDIGMRNEGFAPIYRDAETTLVALDGEGAEVFRLAFEKDIRTLAGGDDSDKVEVFHADIPLKGFPSGTYRLYFEVRDDASGERILFANETDPAKEGYLVGSFELESAQTWLDRKLEEYGLSFVDWKLDF